MGLMGLYVSSVIMSNYMDFISNGRIFKDMADRGYLILASSAYENYKDGKYNGEINFNNEFVNYLIPIYNIYYALFNASQYKNNLQKTVNYLSTMGILKEMDNEEKEKYRKNPTIFNAFLISVMHEVKETERKEMIEVAKNNTEDAIKSIESAIDELNNNYKDAKDKLNDNYQDALDKLNILKEEVIKNSNDNEDKNDNLEMKLKKKK